MTERDLYLFKAARRPLYRKENLALLAAERGSVVDVSYNRTWVAPVLQAPGTVSAGTQVRLIYTDRPYTHFVPVRSGEVIEAAWDELMLRLRLVLGNWIGLDSIDPVEFAARLKAGGADVVPGSRFVSVRQDDLAFTSYYDHRENEGWRRAVDGVLEMSAANEERPYHGSVFFRPIGIRADGELHSGRRVPLAPGTRASLVLAFHNPHMSDDDVARHTLRVLAPEESLKVEAPERFPAVGELEVPFEVTGTDPVLTVEIGPTPAAHTSLTLRLGSGLRTPLAGFVGASSPASTVAEPTSGVPPSPVHVDADRRHGDGDLTVTRRDLLRLYDVVVRNARMEPADALDVLDAFERLLPGEQRLAERRALTLAALEDGEAAWNVLRGLDPELMCDDARFLFVRLHAARDGGVGLLQRVLTLGLTSEGRFARFLEELESLPSRALARLVPALVAELPAEQLREVIARVGARLESPDALAETARNLYLATDDAEWAFSYLDARRHELRLGDPVIIDALMELAAAGGRTDGASDLWDEAARRIGNLIERGQLDAARVHLRQAGSALRRWERDRLYHRVADRVERRGDWPAAAEVMVELAYAACASGDLESATNAVERAVGLWTATPRNGGAVDTGSPPVMAEAEANGASALPPWLADAVAAVRRAWESFEELAEWRRDADERRREALRAEYLNRRILIAGGKRNPEWVERLRELTGAEVDWAERYRDEGDDLAAYAERIRQKHYAVVVYLLQKSGHEVQHRLKPACDEAGVPWVSTTTAGWRGVVEAVEGTETEG